LVRISGVAQLGQMGERVEVAPVSIVPPVELKQVERGRRHPAL
jgi:hypothetical protein